MWVPFPPHCQKKLASVCGHKISKWTINWHDGAGHAGSATGSGFGGGQNWPWIILIHPKRTTAIIKIP